MKIIYNDWLKNGIDDYLLSQDGINNVKIEEDGDYSVIEIDTNLSSYIISNYINLYQDNKTSYMVGFDKGKYNDYDEYIYTVNDLCCEYCHMNFINDLFDNDNIISVKSDFDFINKNNVNYNICYKKDFNIINFIKKIGV